MRSRMILVLWGVVLIVVATIPFGYLHLTRAPQSVSGIILDVQATSMVFADQITLRDSSGSLWRFRVDPEVVTNNQEPQSASHLRQHMAVADPVTVRYIKLGSELVAMRIVDGP